MICGGPEPRLARSKVRVQPCRDEDYPDGAGHAGDVVPAFRMICRAQTGTALARGSPDDRLTAPSGAGTEDETMKADDVTHVARSAFRVGEIGCCLRPKARPPSACTIPATSTMLVVWVSSPT